jgi:hypothetical protein
MENTEHGVRHFQKRNEREIGWRRGERQKEKERERERESK